jgi:hypothetical protein
MTEEQKRVVGDLRMLIEETPLDMPITRRICTHAVSLIEKLAEELERVKRDRDETIVNMMRTDYCEACAHNYEEKHCECYDYDCDSCKEGCACKCCRNGSSFEWRGMCKENGGVKE